MGGVGAADSGVGKKRTWERAITLAGDEAKPTPPTSSIPAALSASSSSMPAAASNTNNSWRVSTGRHDLSQLQLVLSGEMLKNANATADITPENIKASTPLPPFSSVSGPTPAHPLHLLQAKVGCRECEQGVEMGRMQGIIRLRFLRRRRGGSKVGRDGVGG